MALRRDHPDPAAPAIIEAARHAIARARASGTGLFGDVSNTLVTVPLLRDAGMAAHVFYELIGFSHPDPVGRVREARAAADAAAINAGGVRVSLAPHAPYSVSPELFMRHSLRRRCASRSGHERAPRRVGGRSGTAPAGQWTGAGAARASSASGPTNGRFPAYRPSEYVAALGFLERTRWSCTACSSHASDLARVKTAGSPLVSCPRSNTLRRRWRAAARSLLRRWRHRRIWHRQPGQRRRPEHVRGARRGAAHRATVSARELLRSATLTGAQALRFDDDYGSIEAGKRAALIAVRVPPDVVDVEEYLVAGIEPDAIAWLDTIHE